MEINKEMCKRLLDLCRMYLDLTDMANKDGSVASYNYNMGQAHAFYRAAAEVYPCMGPPIEKWDLTYEGFGLDF